MHEREPEQAVRIYVASLSDYNAGRLHGIWLNAAVDDDELAGAVEAMLAASPEPGAEEFAVHDYEGFGPLNIGEFEPLTTVTRIARGIAEHGPAFAHWANLVGREDDAALEQFDEVYQGHYESLRNFGETLIDDLGWQQELDAVIPVFLIPYVSIDVEAFVRDLMLSGDYMTGEAEIGGIYVFEGQNR